MGGNKTEMRLKTQMLWEEFEKNRGKNGMAKITRKCTQSQDNGIWIINKFQENAE